MLYSVKNTAHKKYMRVKRIVFINRAPFGHLDLSFENVDVVSLTGINGAGKTTILSYIVDAFHEIAKKAYHQEYSGNKENKLYRISTDLNNYNSAEYSLVYICFSFEKEFIHYCDFQGEINESSFNEMMTTVGDNIVDLIKYSNIANQLKHGQNYAKYVSLGVDESLSVFNKGIATYFPSYRYEQPGYLNDVYQLQLRFKNTAYYSGYLPNPIEVTSDLPEIANWMMDIILDRQVYPGDESIRQMFNLLNNLITSILTIKPEINSAHVGVGRRHLGGARIQIVDKHNKTIYPSIFNMSAGESALFSLFGELIKQVDRIGKTVEDIEGIVLVDEIEKHLHISMQMLPVTALMKMFPNLQFIVSTHSAFINLGLKDRYGDKCKIIDLNRGGVECAADENGVFREAYDVMAEENNRYADAYKEICTRIHASTKPYIVTEGKTDWKHIKAAMKALGIDDLDVEFREFEETLGDTDLMRILKECSKVPKSRPIIGVFDRDSFDKVEIKNLKDKRFVNIGNNVYAFAIPVVHQDIYGTEEISIEHYYQKEDLTKEDSNHRRIFLGEEFYSKGVSKNRTFITRIKSIDKKTEVNGVIDEKVYSIQDDPEEKKSLALSKNDFAQLIYCQDSYAEKFDFTAFEEIIEVIREICMDIEGKHILKDMEHSCNS